MTAIDLSFQVNSRATFPVDHCYALVGAVSRLIPEAHGGNGFAIAPIPGKQIGGRQMMLDERSRFVIRTSADRIAQFLPLAGKTIDVFGRKLVLGVPSIFPLVPSSSLRARIVTIKGFFEPEPFREAVRRQLDKLEVGSCDIHIGRQRTLRIKANEIIGFETTLSQLSETDSLNVATQGLGGRRHMGCGFFVACKREVHNGQA
jgi:CRISPR-associated endonuclease/helicase Cas3